MPLSSKQFKEKFLKNRNRILWGVVVILKNRNRILWGVVVILAVYFIYFVVINASRSTQGFASYYTASKLLTDGENVSRFYDDDWFSGNGSS